MLWPDCCPTGAKPLFWAARYAFLYNLRDYSDKRYTEKRSTNAG